MINLSCEGNAKEAQENVGTWGISKKQLKLT
jgi:hypothetical protein